MSRGLKKDGGSSSREFKGVHFLEFVAPEHRDFVLSRWGDAKKGIYKWIILHKNVHWHDREGQIKGPKGLVYVIFSKK